MKLNGFVSIVGGGPGDPELITFKGMKAIEQSQVVVYDALIDPELLKHAPAKSKKIYVGKRRHKHTYEQGQINQILLDYAKMGKKVCRLKGGDPFMFGRGGEEAEFLAKNGIPFEVIPGISSIIAAPLAAGIPLTHRDYASSVTIATGHEVGKKGSSVWARYSPKKSLVVLMGLARLKEIVQELIHSGWPSQMPIALICSGTLPHQFCLVATLKNILKEVSHQRKNIYPPALIVVGEVVHLREKINLK